MVYKNYKDIFDNKTKKYYSPTGDGYLDTYELKFDKETGIEILVKMGKRNIDDEIQAFKESSEITNIIERFINGEIDLLHQVDGIYADVTNAPTSYAEYFNKVKEAEKIFDQLPDEVKDKFDNSAEKFFLEFGTDSFNEKVNNDNSVIDEANIIKENYDNAE